ncbi:MAG: TetR/AcrR family transcriptional regulator [Williamsia sp.]|nr:TetR/AcrR family transcriptional regulator [Williamsia sp.]
MSKKEIIMQKAIELFSTYGFDNTPIRELCQRAGVNIAMINYYFGSKEGLFEAIIEYKSHYMKELLQGLQADTSMTEMEKVNLLIDQYVNRIWSHPLFHKILHQEMMLKSRPEVNRIIEKMFSRNMQFIKSILEDGMKKGIFRKIDPEFTIASMLGTINHFMNTPAIYLLLSGEEQHTDPYQNDAIKKRLITHLKQLMEAHLLKK